jgi:hypothetical protein
MQLGRRAWPRFYENFMKLWKKHGTTPRYARIPDNFEAAVSNRAAIVGSPATIRDAVYRMAEEAGASYFIVLVRRPDPRRGQAIGNDLCPRGNSLNTRSSGSSKLGLPSFTRSSICGDFFGYRF